MHFYRLRIALINITITVIFWSTKNIQITINEIMHSHKGNTQKEACYEYKIMWT